MKKILILISIFIICLNLVIGDDKLYIDNPEPKTKVFIEISCYKDEVNIRRIFNIRNEDLDDNLIFPKESYDYILALADNIPLNVKVKDNQGEIYSESFKKFKELYILDFKFPKSGLRLLPRQEYYLETSYSTKDFILDGYGNKVLKPGINMIDLRKLDTFQVIIPSCFLMKREFIKSTPEPDKKEIIDGDLILTYNQPILNDTRTNTYDPIIEYKYSMDIANIIKYLVGLIFTIVIGYYVTEYILRKKARILIYFDKDKTYHKRHDTISNREGIFMHLMVKNKSKIDAKNCYGELIDIKVKKANNFIKHDGFLSNLLLKWAHEPNFDKKDITKNDERRLDLCYTLEGIDHFFIFTEQIPRGTQTIFKKGEYTATVRVSGDNFKSEMKKIKIVFDGTWEGIKFQEI